MGILHAVGDGWIAPIERNGHATSQSKVAVSRVLSERTTKILFYGKALNTGFLQEESEHSSNLKYREVRLAPRAKRMLSETGLEGS